MRAATLHDVIEESVRIPALPAPLEGLLTYPEQGGEPRALVIAGPHPLLGGTIENNVVRELARGAAAQGWLTLRFAYSGPADADPDQLTQFWNEGAAPLDRHAVEDLVAALAFARGIAPVAALVGYSFGCLAIAQFLELSRESLSLALIAPPLRQHDYSAFRRTRAPMHLITAAHDFACDPQSLAAEMPLWPSLRSHQEIPGSDHFFRGHEREVADRVLRALATSMQGVPGR